MKKSLLLLVVAWATLVSSAPSFAQAQAPSGGGGKMKNAAGKMGNAIMWGPRKIGAGFKKVFHKGT